ncbi:hypothetical protein NFHSH190041_11270 [Shewanella sp. NFH-SH190041]|nr:hypothetical protein NFHSH190041_11270 [Shewanella sp. NFH-SH190041]
MPRHPVTITSKKRKKCIIQSLKVTNQLQTNEIPLSLCRKSLTNAYRSNTPLSAKAYKLTTQTMNDYAPSVRLN